MARLVALVALSLCLLSVALANGVQESHESVRASAQGEKFHETTKRSFQPDLRALRAAQASTSRPKEARSVSTKCCQSESVLNSKVES